MKKKEKRAKRFKLAGKKPKTRRELKNVHRNDALSGDRMTLREKEKDVKEGVHEDTQRPMAA
jgi:hypothetical protein